MYNSSNCTFRSTLGSAEIPQNASAKFNPSVSQNQLGPILHWYTNESACNINVSDVHIPCDIDGSSQTETTRCNKSSAFTDEMNCARVVGIDFNSNCDSLQCIIAAPAEGMCSVQPFSNTECGMATIISSVFMTSTSATSLMLFHDSSSTIMTLKTEYLSASATQYLSSGFVSSDMYSSFFPIILPTPLDSSQLISTFLSSQPISASPTPTSLNCPLDPPWLPTLAGYNATNTCHKGLFNGQFDFIIFYN